MLATNEAGDPDGHGVYTVVVAPLWRVILLSSYTGIATEPTPVFKNASDPMILTDLPIAIEARLGQLAKARYPMLFIELPITTERRLGHT
jgi:hypothetical protein